MRKKRILSLLLSLAVCIAFMPAAVFADGGGGKAIQNGIGDITGYNSADKTYDYIYYGTWRDTPIKWRVLDTKDNTGKEGALFLLTDECLYPLPGGLFDCYIQFNPEDKTDRYLWKDSTLQNWFKNTFYSGENSAFTDAEREMILAVNKIDKQGNYIPDGGYYGPYFPSVALENEHVFAPSIWEITDKNYGFSGLDSAGPTDATDAGTRYWLRSHYRMSGLMPVFVGEGGNLTGDQIADKAAVRPAMNLTTSDGNILFVSAAEGGKPAGGLNDISEYVGSEWKLTLKDSTRAGFNVTTKEVFTTNHGGDISISYSGAKTGNNEHISAILKDKSGKPIWYGRSSESLTAEEGTATIPVAAGLAAGDYNLYVYNEQYNGDKRTDYASDSKTVSLKVNEAETYIVTYNPGKDGTGTEYTDNKIEGIDLELSKKTFNRDGYKQIGWTKTDGGEKVYDLGSIYTANEAVTLYPVWERQYGLSVRGITVTENNKSDVLIDGGSVKFEDLSTAEGAKYRLTLKGAILSGESEIINYSDTGGVLEIVLEGDNKITAEDYGISSDADELIFSGEGSLTVKATDNSGTAINSVAGELTVKGGNIEAEGNIAVSSGGILTVSGGTLTLKASADGHNQKAILSLASDKIVDLGTYGVMLTSENADGRDAAVTKPSDTEKIKAAKYVRIFDRNVPITYKPGTNGTGDESAVNKIYGESFKLAGEIFTRTGYTQTGWTTTDGGNKVYELGAAYTGNEALTLYPVWAVNRYSITYELDGGTAEGNPDGYTVESEDINLNEPAKDGYIFIGWSGTDLTGENNMTVAITKGSTGDRSYTAHWRYKGGGGSYNPAQKPEIITGEGGKTSPENNGSTLVITPDEGMEISKVTVNGKEVTVTNNKITGLKTGDKVEVTFAKTPPTKEETDNIFKGKALKLSLAVRTSKTTKKNIRVAVKKTKELKYFIRELADAGYTVKYKFYRSVKKTSKYKARIVKTTDTYINTAGKKGRKYYYKAKLLIYDNGGRLIAQTELKQCRYGKRTWTR